ncbi:MAG: DUF5320 domain-containing protein [Spirochaetales bacterium]|nr:DUF5320 domain-containing protein [Spirochaetales bacterium]MCF7937163.1 DUF5320 domain-containing protein [Spirochaetales bacterium]
MPRGDRTGPVGYGPMSGRGLGFCAGYDAPGFMNWSAPRMGRGWGRGWGGAGFGRGNAWRRGWGAPGPGYAGPGMYGAPYGGVPYSEAAPSPEDEAEYLRQQAKYLEREQAALNKRLRELESGQSGEESK